MQNPPKRDRIEDLGFALEEWLAWKGQDNKFSNHDGSPCRVQDDTLMAAMYKLIPKGLEKTLLFKSDEAILEFLYDELVPRASVKHSSRSDDKPSRSEVKQDPNAMEVAALSKGGNSKSGKGKDVPYWICGTTCHMNNDGKSRGKSIQSKCRKGATWSATTVEVIISVEIAHPVRSTGKEARRWARATRKATARKRARKHSPATKGLRREYHRLGPTSWLCWDLASVPKNTTVQMQTDEGSVLVLAPRCSTSGRIAATAMERARKLEMARAC